MIDPTQLNTAHAKARTDLLTQRTDDLHWEGELSSSALSTATAISALAIAAKSTADSSATGDQDRIEAGLRWLLPQQNQDGGWGDTDKSHSNISTTMLAVAAIHLAGRADSIPAVLARANAYIARLQGIAGLRKRYGKDKTFAVPILANYALAELADWSEVSPLPFELACVPQRIYHWMRMPVVSYAIPALVAIGQARFFHRPPRLPWMRLVRRWAVARSLRVLEQMQPASGGFLEAVPLTSFVTMSLASTGRTTHRVTQRGLTFIRDSLREDGSWPIDTNLATWTTSLSINALAHGVPSSNVFSSSILPDSPASDSPASGSTLSDDEKAPRQDAIRGVAEGARTADVASKREDTEPEVAQRNGGKRNGGKPEGGNIRVAEASARHDRAARGNTSTQGRSSVERGHGAHTPDEPTAQSKVLDWLLACQHTQRHPYTGAAPGGWGWTSLSGAVPDADDTAGALLALGTLRSSSWASDTSRARIQTATIMAVTWLLDLQNRDGGWPTFCRGWGKLPFDRSGADLTAHAMRALNHWRDTLPRRQQRRIERALRRAWKYLQRQQHPDGSWAPLWFGHQDHPDEENPVFGTARVLKAYQELGRADTTPAQRGYDWLASVQQSDGGWSGFDAQQAAGVRNASSSVEETALAVEALLGCPQVAAREAALSKGLQWLIEAVLADRHWENAPIGFYFAKLWYHERLYPLIFTVAALGQAVPPVTPQHTHSPAKSPTS